MYDPFIIPFKTTNSSTSESLMLVMEYLYPSYSALSTATLQNLATSIIIMRIVATYTYSRDHQHENSSTVVWTTMLGMTGKHVDR